MAEPQLLMKGVPHTFVPNGSFHVLGIISTLKGSIWWNLKFNFMMFCMHILWHVSLHQCGQEWEFFHY
jgi:hypothetical protein